MKLLFPFINVSKAAREKKLGWCLVDSCDCPGANKRQWIIWVLTTALSCLLQGVRHFDGQGQLQPRAASAVVPATSYDAVHWQPSLCLQYVSRKLGRPAPDSAPLTEQPLDPCACHGLRGQRVPSPPAKSTKYLLRKAEQLTSPLTLELTHHLPQLSSRTQTFPPASNPHAGCKPSERFHFIQLLDTPVSPQPPGDTTHRGVPSWNSCWQLAVPRPHRRLWSRSSRPLSRGGCITGPNFAREHAR